MRILAIETVDQSGSVAALVNGDLLAARDLNPAMRSAQALAPALAELLPEAGWQPRDVELVAVAVGPGSFTGLRVGVTTAKMFAYAVGAGVMGLNALEAIAWQAPEAVSRVWAVLDAQRDQVFAGLFSRDNVGVWQWRGETQLLDDAVWLAGLSSDSAVCGPALVKLAARVPPGISIVDAKLWSPKAATVGQLAWRQYQVGRRDDLWSLVPKYFRRSAAEEKLASRND